MNLNPVGEQVIIRPDMDFKKTEGGLFLTDRAQDLEWKLRRTGTVVAVGEGLVTKKGVRVPIDLKPGDRVIFNQMCEAHDIGDEKFIFARWTKDVLAKLEG